MRFEGGFDFIVYGQDRIRSRGSSKGRDAGMVRASIPLTKKVSWTLHEEDLLTTAEIAFSA